jgi:predicted metal-dependent HD superfamily phosphohydrolase
VFKEEFLNSFNESVYRDNPVRLWSEIETKYTSSSRHYHNLKHLDDLIGKLHPLKDHFSTWTTIVFAVAYHDFVYNVMKGNNEEKSASIAAEKLSGIGVTSLEIDKCKRLIMATRNHEHIDDETDIFTDADLSILGSDTQTYRDYARLIRKEYKIFPDFVYYPGRQKVLHRFMEMKHIFKSPYFTQYEAQARENIAWEMGDIQNRPV